MSSLSTSKIKVLEQKLLALQKQIKRTLKMDQPSEAIVELDQSAIGRLTRMDAMQNQAITQATQEQHRVQLQRIAEALEAIKDNDYGYCDECGNPIPFQRLTIKPETHCCVGCQEKLELNT